MAGTEYPKIETLYNRNALTMQHVIPGALRDEAFGLVDRWLVTEKIHGTNVRITYENGEVLFGGKTDRAQLPLHLVDALRTDFYTANLAALWPSTAEDGGPVEHPRIVLYGEGYGPKIQKGGGNYRADIGFRLFDVCVRGDDRLGHDNVWWLNWPDVEDVTRRLGVETVPVLARNATTARALDLVKDLSVVARAEGSVAVIQEGIVCRTDPLLFTRRGQRLIWKLKASDLPPTPDQVPGP